MKAILLTAMLLATGGSALAQERGLPRDPFAGADTLTAVDTLMAGGRDVAEDRQLAARRAAGMPDATFLIDSPVDRATYAVGPGDVLAVSIFGDLNLLYELPVTPEGTLVVPTVGVIPVVGLTLAETEELVGERFLRFYRNVEVRLTLARVRAFKVYVVGAVADPGARVASSVTRVSELVPDSAGIALRNVILQRASGDTVQVDLTRFRHTGDTRFNPRVREGDTILVPGVDRTVEVYGRVFFPGTYEFREGETLAELLQVANGYRGFPSDAHELVHVSRFDAPSRREFRTFTRVEALGPSGQAFALEPFDALYVPGVSNYREQKTATITGEVVHPGTYPIRPDTTRVRELIDMAGGLTPEASLTAARLLRAPPDPETEFQPVDSIPLELLTEQELEVVRIRQRANDRNVVIDFEDLLRGTGESFDLALRDRDSLYVPELKTGVTVIGAVLTPGIVEHAPGRSIEEYVRLAGGYSERADEGEVAVLKVKLQTQLDRDDVRALDPGDTIVVPFEEERDWLAIFNTTAGVVGSIASITLAIIAANR